VSSVVYYQKLEAREDKKVLLGETYKQTVLH